jgi:hypothetical protein
VQNKLLFAVTGKTAAEIVVSRTDPESPNMALTTWSGSRVRKHDVIVAKNYLTEDEVDTLNRLVVIFLEQAELRTKERKELILKLLAAKRRSAVGIQRTSHTGTRRQNQRRGDETNRQ